MSSMAKGCAYPIHLARSSIAEAQRHAVKLHATLSPGGAHLVLFGDRRQIGCGNLGHLAHHGQLCCDGGNEDEARNVLVEVQAVLVGDGIPQASD